MITIYKFVFMFPIVYGILKLNEAYLWSERISRKLPKYKYYLLILFIIMLNMIFVEIFKRVNLSEFGIAMIEAIGLGLLASLIPYKNMIINR